MTALPGLPPEVIITERRGKWVVSVTQPDVIMNAACGSRDMAVAIAGAYAEFRRENPLEAAGA